MSQQHNEIREGDEYFCTKCHKRWGTDEEAPPCVDKKYMTVVLEYEEGNESIKEVTEAFTNNTTLFGAKVTAVSLKDEISRCEKLEEELLR